MSKVYLLVLVMPLRPRNCQISASHSISRKLSDMTLTGRLSVKMWPRHTSMKTECDSVMVLHGAQPGADPGFPFRGGGGRLCARTHITSAKPEAPSAGVQDPLKDPGSSRVYALPYYLSLILKHSDTKYKKNAKTIIVHQILGGRRLLRPPLDPPLHVHEHTI